MSVVERVPQNERVVVELMKPEEKKTAAGILLPPVAKKRGSVDKGVVILADPRVAVKAGETVYFRPNVGLEIELDGKDYLIIPATQLELAERVA